jgi:hypothetical protein
MGRIRYIPNQGALDNYYSQQSGGGDFYFKGPSYQRGHGLGGLFGKLFRTAIPVFRNTVSPILKRGAKAVAREALNTGVGVASDLLDGGSLQDSVERRGQIAAQRLMQKGAAKMNAMLNQPTRRSTPARKRRKTIKGRRDIYN